ncbi:hypothetical protein L6164_015432 [Bauhinia variegata]|uniref:Uncharacterized protein n=1 Tax=Bauhinia variegata TaxID=167791 RepID=A0ACB9NL60_BAUVA|nr:hypothetical protein L6164_015432 [Bauhinia variegata]
MQAVGRLGSYISRGVYTVSGPFHPFGGAVDIVVVEQQDGSFKSSPWYVRFGKFQGVLKAKEKVVNISVNGVEANFHMYLDSKGEAYFLREMDADEGDSTISIYPSSSSDETESRPQDNKRFKSQSCNFDSDKSNSVARDKIVGRTNSRRSRILGLVFGRKSMKGDVDNNCQKKMDDSNVHRTDSLERAEIAANLLEVRWSTNLAGRKMSRKDSNRIRESSSLRDFKENGGLDDHREVPTGLSDQKGVNLSFLSTPDEVIGTFVASEESCAEGKPKVIAQVPTEIDQYIGDNADSEHGINLKVISHVTASDLQVACLVPEARNEKQLNGEEVSGVSIVDIPGYGISDEEISSDKVRSLVYCKTSEASVVAMNCSGEQTHGVLYLANGVSGQVHVHAEVLHATTVLLPEDAQAEEVTENVDLGMPAVEASENYSQKTDCSPSGMEDPPALPKNQTVNVDLGLCSVEKVLSNYVATTSSHSSLGNRALDENNTKEEDVPSSLSPSLESDCVLSRATSRPPSTSSEDEHFLFSDLDERRISDGFKGSISPEHVDNEDNFSNVDCTENLNQLIDTNYSLHSSPENSMTESRMTDHEMLTETSSSTVIPRDKVPEQEVGKQEGSLPNMYSHSNSLGHLSYPLSHSLDSKSESKKWTLLGKEDLKFHKSDEDKENHLILEEPVGKDSHISGEFKGNVPNSPIGDPSMPSPLPGGNWRLWPFSLRRSRPGEALLPASSDVKNPSSGSASENTIYPKAEKNEFKPKLTKRMIKAKAPTSEQLASLNLKEGRNVVTFSFCTDMLGKQEVDARIYLWKWNTRIVISDVDGTITKSDVLGQFMPLVGVDWSQTGVAHLYSAIKENGYQLLFLSARAISQAYHTRRFLFNLKQDGKALPDGPVVISPNGLFPSLYREVIRRAPHEFKISCLADIRALFPSECNPFYAGFGNRHTDEISYLKVGIPKGKIFTINPKGEVAVNRCLDTKSYTSLHALVNGMFPPTSSSEQPMQEDFNSWNFWKLPPPIIDV